MSLEGKMVSMCRRRKRALDEVLEAALDAARQDFRSKFGRAPLPGEPLLFDPSKDTPTLLLPEALDRMMVQSMVEADIRGELIHAYQKTGMIVTEENRHLFSKADFAEYEAAIAEYFQLQDGQRH
jgi:hypothetical protein